MTPHSPEGAFRIIITADRGAGKTTFIRRVASFLAMNNIPHTGFFADGTWERDTRSSFTLNLLPELASIPLCDRSTEGWLQHGRFRYNPAALNAGCEVITRARPGEIIIMDEIGRQELEGHIWAGTLNEAINGKNPLLLSVQYQYLDEIIEKWNLRDSDLFNGNVTPWDTLWHIITSGILSR